MGPACAVGAWAFDLALSISILVVPAVLLVVTTAAAVGYAMASVLPPPGLVRAPATA